VANIRKTTVLDVMRRLLQVRSHSKKRMVYFILSFQQRNESSLKSALHQSGKKNVESAMNEATLILMHIMFLFPLAQKCNGIDPARPKK